MYYNKMSRSEHIHYAFCVFVISFVSCEGRFHSYAGGGQRWPLREGDRNPSSLKEAEPGFDLSPEEMEKFKIWPAGVIPYFIDNLSFDKVIRDRLRTFLNSVNSMTGLQFVELQEPPEGDGTRFVLFINRIGQLNCEDHTTNQFTNQGVQRVLLGYNCFNDRDLASVVLALAGVPPQHNAPNRDNYVSIETDNILPDKKHLFKDLSNTDWLFHDIEYDFQSAGHYPLHKYSSNGFATIKPLAPLKTDDVGMGEGFSYSDIWKIRMLYSYIKIREASKKQPCGKIFRPGPAFQRYSPDKGDDVQPRKKPDKYLGLTGAGENKNENENEHQEKGKVENEDTKQYDIETDNMDDQHDIEEYNDPHYNDMDDQHDNENDNDPHYNEMDEHQEDAEGYDELPKESEKKEEKELLSDYDKDWTALEQEEWEREKEIQLKFKKNNK